MRAVWTSDTTERWHSVALTVCDSCGEPVVAGVQFCTNCGFFLDFAEAPVDETPPETHGATAPETVRRSPAEPETSTDPAPATVTEFAPPPLPVPARPRRESRASVPPGVPCSRCGTPNPGTRRFCAKCGLFIGTPAGDDQLRAFRPPSRTWWQRLLHGRPGSERAARTAYRRSLPWPVRLRRVLIVVGVLLLGFGYLHFVGRDPIGWARQRIDALRGTVVVVPGVKARATSGASSIPKFPAADAVDGYSDTAWATGFDGPKGVTGTACAAAPDANGLVLSAPEQVTVRAIKIRSGVPGKDGDLIWRPHTIELWFPNGACQRINLANSPKPQQVAIHPVKTNTVRIAIVAGYQQQGGSTKQVTAITEIALLQRPK